LKNDTSIPANVYNALPGAMSIQPLSLLAPAGLPGRRLYRGGSSATPSPNASLDFSTKTLRLGGFAFEKGTQTTPQKPTNKPLSKTGRYLCGFVGICGYLSVTFLPPPERIMNNTAAPEETRPSLACKMVLFGTIFPKIGTTGILPGSSYQPGGSHEQTPKREPSKNLHPVGLVPNKSPATLNKPKHGQTSPDKAPKKIANKPC
jgi:hypothetical protein